MNISEANDVATLLRALTGQVVTNDQVVDAATRLRERVHKALMVAPEVHEDMVRRAVRRIFGSRE